MPGPYPYCRECEAKPCDCDTVRRERLRSASKARRQRLDALGFEPPDYRAYTVGDAIGLRRMPRPAPLRVPVEPAEVAVVPAVEPHDARLAWVRARALEALHGAAIGLAVGAAVGVLLAALRRAVL